MKAAALAVKYAIVLVTAVGISPAASSNRRQTRQAVFAGGCFWGVEAAFRKMPGVIATTAGYCGGDIGRPTYQQVSRWRTGFAESVLVTYDPARISYAELLDVFWSCHDPTADRGQGVERGPHRSVIFVDGPAERSIAEASRAEVSASGLFHHPIRTEIVPAAVFYPAERYHQHYFEKMGVTGTCETGLVAVHTRLAARARRLRQAADRLDGTGIFR